MFHTPIDKKTAAKTTSLLLAPQQGLFLFLLLGELMVEALVVTSTAFHDGCISFVEQNVFVQAGHRDFFQISHPDPIPIGSQN